MDLEESQVRYPSLKGRDLDLEESRMRYLSLRGEIWIWSSLGEKSQPQVRYLSLR